MASYFQHFPKIEYAGEKVTDITRRAFFVQYLKDNPFIFLPYTVKDGEKPEDIAYHYYGSVDYTWAVLMANNIFDMNTDWPMDDDTFSKYLMRKYEALSRKKGHEVLEWLQISKWNFYANVAYYYDEVNDVRYSVDTIRLGGAKPNTVAVRYYDIETQENENKRHIMLVDDERIADVEKQFRTLINK